MAAVASLADLSRRPFCLTFASAEGAESLDRVSEWPLAAPSGDELGASDEHGAETSSPERTQIRSQIHAFCVPHAAIPGLCPLVLLDAVGT